MTFFTQSSTTFSTIEPTSIDSFTKIDWDLVKQNVKAFDIYRQLANQTGISLQECFFNNKVDLSPYEIEDPEIQNYISSVPLFSELEKKYPFTIKRCDSAYPTTDRRYVAMNMITLSVTAYARCWRDLPVTNDNDRYICLNMLKKMQNNQRDSALLHTFTRMGMKISKYIEDKHKLYDITLKLPSNRNSIFRLFGEYGTLINNTRNAVSYPTGLTAEQLYQLCQHGFIDTHMTPDEAEKLIKTVVKHGLDYTIHRTKSLNYFDNHPQED